MGGDPVRHPVFHALLIVRFFWICVPRVCDEMAGSPCSEKRNGQHHAPRRARYAWCGKWLDPKPSQELNASQDHRHVQFGNKATRFAQNPEIEIVVAKNVQREKQKTSCSEHCVGKFSPSARQPERNRDKQ